MRPVDLRRDPLTIQGYGHPAGDLDWRLPIRDMGLLTRHREDFAADPRLSGAAVGEEALRGGDHGHSEPVADARDLVDPDVTPHPGRETR